jgi:hypothetical protein
MAHHGFITGYPDKGFHPGDKITRAQMATLMSRASVRDLPYLAGIPGHSS